MKIIKLIAPVDNENLGLHEGESYYVLTHAEGVDGLSDFILKIAPRYFPATSQENGLLAKEDKTKLDQLDLTSIEKRLKWLEDHIIMKKE